MKYFRIFIYIFVIAIAVYIYWQISQRDQIEFPAGKSATTTVLLSADNKEVLPQAVIEKVNQAENVEDNLVNNSEQDKEQDYITKEIMITGGLKHSVPLTEIKGGGPVKDGIPSIDKPIFHPISVVSEWLGDNEPGISVSFNGVDRFYPFQILVWHEIVNDTIDGKRVLITYCPLCLSGIVFDPVVDGERVEFGTSGKLWNSNLVMYDRKTDSLWSQILGEAIVGEMTGVKLEVLPSDQMRFGEWKKLHPGGQVLSKETGAVRFYGQDPYGSYYTDDTQIISPVNNTDNRLDNKDFVLGIVIDGKAKAYLPEAIKQAGEVEDEFAGVTIVARYEEELDAIRIFEKVDDNLKRINPFPNFWFSWVAAHPDTELYK